jgi:putative DNA primase/helicase
LTATQAQLKQAEALEPPTGEWPEFSPPDDDMGLMLPAAQPCGDSAPSNDNSRYELVEDAGYTAECSDVRNAERLITWFGDGLRYVYDWSKWLTWDGKQWTVNQKRAQAAAVETSRMLLKEAGDGMARAQAKLDRLAYNEAAADSPEKLKAAVSLKRAKALFEWANRSQFRGALAAMLDVASSDASVAITSDQLDADNMLLNCDNGTIDLRTGKLLPHQRGALFTMSSPVAFDPDAQATVWEAFISRAMGGDAEMIAYLQRVVGYLITGMTTEQCLFFFYGGGANGKSTFTNTLLSLLGSGLAGPAPRNMLFSAERQEHATREASLFRKRFVLCSEIGEGKRLDEALVKDITGGDQITARRMREDFWDFTPTHKIVISGNHKPIIIGTDDGIWRRMRLVPWVVTIPPDERDKDLVAKLKAESAGILAWAVRGCLQWQRVGLSDPPAVLKATGDFRSASDALTDFFDMLEFGDPNNVHQFKISKAALRKAYTTWCDTEGHYPLGARRLTERLRQRAIELGANLVDGVGRSADSTHPTRCWFGVRIGPGK